jgi:S-adenosylmethionine synthetase
MKQDFMFTSESVTEGHPDKLCDQISDAIIDRFLQQDPFSRVIAECAVSNGILFIASRFASNASFDIPEIARQVIHQVGYHREDFNAKTCTVMTSFTELPDNQYRMLDERTLDEEELERITAKNVANAFGFACTHTPAMIPLPVWLAHKLARRLAAVRLQRQLAYLAPDGKTQVGVEFRNHRPYRIHSIMLIASQYGPALLDIAKLRIDLYEHVIQPVFLNEELKPDASTQIFVNPEGLFVTGGPSRHSGLTGRKTAMDTYGEYCRNSEAALSGKDPTRIDRVGVYAARYAAKNVIAAGLAEECEVQLTYSIGQARPVSIQVETYGTGTIPDEKIVALVKNHFDFRPAGIIRQFNLRYLPALLKGGFYKKLAAYGHVGRMDIGLPWELTDRALMLR